MGSPGYRYIAQRVLTGEFVDWDVPLTTPTGPRRELSGPGGLTGTVETEYTRLVGRDGNPVLDPWSTAIYAELNGHLRWGGLVVGGSFENGTATVECAGFSTYPHGIPFLSNIRAGVAVPQPNPYAGKDKNNDGYVDFTDPPRSTKIPPAPKPIVTARVDAFDVVRTLWSHVQSYPSGDLNMVLDSQDSGYLLGAADGSDPYELLAFDLNDCGEEIDTLAKLVPFDYVEEHAWVGTSQTISHRLRLGTPRIGSRRRDLRFAQDENIVSTASPERFAEDFANEVYGIGKGQGRKTLTGRFTRNDGRLRRVHVFTDKRISSKDRLAALSRRELAERQAGLFVPMIEVRDHPNARIGSWHLGDDILVQVDVPWVGDLAVWHRIVAEETTPEGHALLTLVRADVFT